MRKVGPHTLMDSDPCTAEMLGNTTAPLRMMRCLLEKRLMVTHANGSFIFNATAIERGQPSRAFKRLPPLESKLGASWTVRAARGGFHVRTVHCAYMACVLTFFFFFFFSLSLPSPLLFVVLFRLNV